MIVSILILIIIVLLIVSIYYYNEYNSVHLKGQRDMYKQQLEDRRNNFDKELDELKEKVNAYTSEANPLVTAYKEMVIELNQKIAIQEAHITDLTETLDFLDPDGDGREFVKTGTYDTTFNDTGICDINIADSFNDTTN